MNQKREIARPKKMTAKEMQEILIENFVGLQRAMTNLSVKFESLSDQIAKLLNIFEMSAKNFVQSSSSLAPETSKDMLEKINSLLDQNKTIAKSLVLMEEGLRDRAEQPMSSMYSMPSIPNFQQSIQDRPKPRPLPRI